MRQRNLFPRLLITRHRVHEARPYLGASHIDSFKRQHLFRLPLVSPSTSDRADAQPPISPIALSHAFTCCRSLKPLSILLSPNPLPLTLCKDRLTSPPHVTHPALSCMRWSSCFSRKVSCRLLVSEPPTLIPWKPGSTAAVAPIAETLTNSWVSALLGALRLRSQPHPHLPGVNAGELPGASNLPALLVRALS